MRFLDEERCMCLFEAPNAETVRELNETAKIPFTRIVEAQNLTPGPGGAGDRKVFRKKITRTNS
ncbi:MAG TPA: nickel-binding protein [Thermoanaerobaculia bacterium]